MPARDLSVNPWRAESEPNASSPMKSGCWPKLRRMAVASVIGSHGEVLAGLKKLQKGSKTGPNQVDEIRRLSRNARLKAARSGFAGAGCARPLL